MCSLSGQNSACLLKSQLPRNKKESDREARVAPQRSASLHHFLRSITLSGYVPAPHLGQMTIDDPLILVSETQLYIKKFPLEAAIANHPNETRFIIIEKPAVQVVC